MPEFETYVDVDVDEFVSACSKREIKELIECLVENGHINESSIISTKMDIIEKYKSKIAVLVSEKDKGIYDAMNKGLERATGDLSGILNSDDTYAYPSVISDIVRQIGDSDSIYADLQYVDGTKQVYIGYL